MIGVDVITTVLKVIGRLVVVVEVEGPAVVL